MNAQQSQYQSVVTVDHLLTALLQQYVDIREFRLDGLDKLHQPSFLEGPVAQLVIRSRTHSWVEIQHVLTEHPLPIASVGSKGGLARDVLGRRGGELGFHENQNLTVF